MAQDQKIILIVEDEPDTAEMFAEMMRLCGYRVFKFYSGFFALQVIAEKKPDVIVLDVMLPGVSGLEILRSLQRDPLLANIPVILVSAGSLPGNLRSGIHLGAFTYLSKPVAYLDLKRAVENALLVSVSAYSE